MGGRSRPGRSKVRGVTGASPEPVAFLRPGEAGDVRFLRDMLRHAFHGRGSTIPWYNFCLARFFERCRG